MVVRVATAKTRQKPNQGLVPEGWIGDILDLTCIGRGNSAMVFAINDLEVIKVGFGSEPSKADIETERRAFRTFEKARDRSGRRAAQLDSGATRLDNNSVLLRSQWTITLGGGFECLRIALLCQHGKETPLPASSNVSYDNGAPLFRVGRVSPGSTAAFLEHS
jgi:hypothetical protein